MSTPRKSSLFTYENGILLLLGFTFGLVFFDRNAINVLMPSIVGDLGLSNTQVGMLGSGLSAAWAISAYVVGAWSDRSGLRKPFLLASTIVFSLCSSLSGLAGSFATLLLVRIVMGFAEGPFLPICFAIMNVESTPSRRGVNAGLMQNVFASLLGTTLAPIVLTWLSQEFGWRPAFYFTGIPGLICAFLVWKFLREPQAEPQAPSVTAGRPGLFAMLKERNILICCGISIFMVSWYLVGLIFMPLYFTVLRGMGEIDMGFVIAPMGIATMVCGFLVPALSDRFGRKPVMAVFTFIGILTPVAALYFGGPLWLLSVLLLIGWSGSGSFALFMGVVPAETVSRALAASSMGLVVGVGELFGGVAAPTVAGAIADNTSLAAPMFVMIACAAIAGILSLFLVETAPRKKTAANDLQLAQAA
ncbi:MAG: MFS transporter [Gammaproteobacteria bacterium]